MAKGAEGEVNGFQGGQKVEVTRVCQAADAQMGQARTASPLGSGWSSAPPARHDTLFLSLPAAQVCVLGNGLVLHGGAFACRAFVLVDHEGLHELCTGRTRVSRFVMVLTCVCFNARRLHGHEVKVFTGSL